MEQIPIAQAAQREFESKWNMEDMPACDEGMILLHRFALARPADFAFLKPEDIDRRGDDAFTGIPEWDIFARHVSKCDKCNEV